MNSPLEELLSTYSPDELQDILFSPRAWAEALLITPNTGELFRANHVQKLILGSKHRRNVVRVHRRAGKCQISTDPITLADGTRVPAGELIGKQFEILTLTETGIRAVPAFAEFNAVEPVYTVITETGRCITRNADHPLYVASKQSTGAVPIISCSGWVRVGDIKPGYYVAVPSTLPVSGTAILPEGEIKLLAYYIGDGGSTDGSSPIFTQQDNSQLKEFIFCAEEIGCKVLATGYLQWRIRGRGNTGRGLPGSNPFITLLRKHSLFRHHSRDKRIPDQIFQLHKQQLALFLSRLYSTDGWACVHTSSNRSRGEIGFCSASKQLVQEVQELLLRFGICGAIRKKPKAEAWSLIVDNCKDVIAFADEIGIYGKEAAVLAAREAAQYQAGWTTRNGTEVRHEPGGSYIKKWKRPDGRPRYLCHTPWRLKNAPPGMCWEKVRSVEFAGVHPTVGITVPEYHTYLTTFYEHNTFSMNVLALFYSVMVESCQILVIAPTGAQVKEIFTSLREFLRVNPWIQDMVREDQQGNQPRIRLSNGSRITGFTTAARSRGRAMSLRGQGADIILVDEAAYLHEEDWGTIQPILQGDEHRRFPPRVFVASTPAYTRGTYYELCMSPRQKKHWHRIHVPITENPNLNQAFIDECSATCLTELDWIKEYLAEFPEIAEGVFPKAMIDRSLSDYKYDTELERVAKERQLMQLEHPSMRCMGVDWDKFNKDGHGSNILILENQGDLGMKVVYREEIPQSKFTLTNAVRRVIELNEIFDPQWIYVDRGYGDYQVEELQKHGKRFPHTKLADIVVGIQFGETIEVPMPGGNMEKKRFKQAMVALLRSWFERSRLVLSEHDADLIKQLTEYHVVSQTEANLKFSDENDHGIAALGLAAMAMHQKIINPYAPKPAHRFYVVPVPEAIPAKMISQISRAQDPNRTLLTWVRDPRAPSRSLSRGSLGMAPPTGRSGF